MNSISTGQLLLYLMNCAVNKRKPENLPEDVDFDQLRELAKFHSVSSMVSYALEEGGYLTEKYMRSDQIQFWATTRILTMRKRTMFDLEREAILANFEEQGIWYMPLKGCILKDFYPDFSMREMADNDILFDPAYRKGLRDYMSGRGYEVKIYNKSVHDVYTKKPFYNFEFHVDLVDAEMNPVTGPYYENIKSRLLKDEDNGFGYHFSDEDFYIYMIVHALKHYRTAGTGIRILTDIYVYLISKGASLDWSYINAQLQLLEDDQLEAQLRTLAMELLSPEKTLSQMVPAEEKNLEVLEYLFGSGTYGTVVNRVQIDLEELRQEDQELSTWTKTKFVLRRLIPDAKHMGRYSPFCRKHKWAIPFFWVYRLVRGVAVRGKSIVSELRAVKNAK